MGSEACSQCPEHTESPVASISKDACICKQGFEGPNGGPCVETPFKPAPRPPTNPSDVKVAMSVSMPIAIEDFKEEQQTGFRTGLANAAGVDVSAVYITNVEPITTRRRSLMAQSIKVSTEITFSDMESATSMSDQMSADKLNAQFKELGLPQVQILESPVVSSPPEMEKDTSESVDDRASTSSSGPWVIIGTIIGVFVMLVLGTLAFIRRRRCKNREAFEVPLTSASPGPNIMPSLASEQRQVLTDASIENPGGSIAVHVQEEEQETREPVSEPSVVGEFLSMNVGPPVEIDQVVMGSQDEDAQAVARHDAHPVARRESGISVRADQIANFSNLLVPSYQSSLEQTLNSLNLDLATVVSDTGFFRARPIESNSDQLLSTQTRDTSSNQDQAQTTTMPMGAANSGLGPTGVQNLNRSTSQTRSRIGGRDLVRQMYASMTSGQDSDDESEHETAASPPPRKTTAA